MTGLSGRIMLRGRPGRRFLFKSAVTRTLEQFTSLMHCSMSTSNFAEETASRLLELGVSKDDILNDPQISRLPFNTIEHRLNYCAEGGIKTSVSSVINFNHIVQSSIPDLKKANILSDDVNVIDSLMSSINFEGPHPSHLDPNDTFEKVHFQTLTHCMQYTFGYSFPPWNRYIHACLKFSLYNIKHCTELNLGWRWIRNHPSLICFANPYNLKKLGEIDRLYELPLTMNTLLRRDPDIAFVDWEDLKAIFFILMKNQVCNHDLTSVNETEHFLVEPDFLEKQFKKVVVPPGAVDINRLLLLYKFKYLQGTLKDKKKEYFHVLLAKRKNPFISAPEGKPGSWQNEMNQWFENKKIQLEHRPCRHEPYNISEDSDEENDLKHEEGYRGKKKGRLARFIAISLDMSHDVVESELNCVPLGNRTPTIRASKTLKFLLESGYSVEEIRPVIQLLLYPRSDVRKALQLVLSNKKYESPTYRSRQLHLCLYHVLMKHNYRVYLPS